MSAEHAFMFSLSPSSNLSQSCVTQGLAGLPLDIPREIICVPAHLVKPSRFDALVPFVLAALLVSASANLIKCVLLGR
ncbi:hypothetical protein Leryth_009562 [Lithospermum erythrorhizon]|nr:hypothetical protein Leryth_009562 [Lithospermum erythrorhizon]